MRIALAVLPFAMKAVCYVEKKAGVGLAVCTACRKVKFVGGTFSAYREDLAASSGIRGGGWDVCMQDLRCVD